MHKTVDGRSVISDFIFLSKYARTVNGRKESWEEAVNRVMYMHWTQLEDVLHNDDVKLSQIRPYFDKAYDFYLKKKVLGAQRGLQYGGEQLRKHNLRLYNCTSTYADRIEFFKELYYALLAGAGCGYSVLPKHVNKIPVVNGALKESYTFVIEDSIEGWAEAAHSLILSHFEGTKKPKFDYSNIRKKGAFISGGFKAPGPDPLRICLEKINQVLTTAAGRKLRPFEVHRLACIIADSVISGGIRRSALIVLFDPKDMEMLNCKTGNWFIKYPELARANNTAVVLPDTSKDIYTSLFTATKEFGEPGIAFIKDEDYTYNPCFEVGMYPQLEVEEGENQSGWSLCNLTEINGGEIKSVEDFMEAAEAAAILGTFQATYTNLNLLGSISEQIVKRDALIGVGITGMAESPEILFNKEYQQQAAKLVVETNIKLAKLLGINPAARATVVKPSGNSSQLLGTSSGIHPFAFPKYIRHIQVTDEEQAANVYAEHNPSAITPSSYAKGNNVLMFPVTIPEKAIVQEDISAIEFLEMVKNTQMNWIEYGTNVDHPSFKKNPGLRHNVSNTVRVRNFEWDSVAEYLWKNKEEFCGVSLLGESGDLDYPQAPFTSYLDEYELIDEYGTAAILAGGLNVDGMEAFGDLWTACNTALGRGEDLKVSEETVLNTIKKGLRLTDKGEYMFSTDVDGLMITDTNAVIRLLQEEVSKKIDWVRRFKKFAKNYFQGDMQKTARCLKHVSIFHRWQKLAKYKAVDWSEVEWHEEFQEVGSQTAQNCGSGQCEL